MIYKIEYADIDERTTILADNADKRLIAESNTDDGNYLTFVDVPPFDLSRDELRAILKLIVDQFNAVRANAGMPEITYAQARDAIKVELGL